jgi:hypothetical protein
MPDRIRCARKCSYDHYAGIGGVVQRGDNEKAEAKRMTLRLHRAANRDDMAGFHKRIEYPSSGWA